MSFLISPAYADGGAGPAGPQGSLLGTVLPLVVMFTLFYFLLIRPQQRRAREQQDMVNALQKGDEVVFAGGLLGRISRLDENYAVIELKDGLDIKIQRSAVTATLPKGTLKSI